jgi:hypothetical protein
MKGISLSLSKRIFGSQEAAILTGLTSKPPKPLRHHHRHYTIIHHHHYSRRRQSPFSAACLLACHNVLCVPPTHLFASSSSLAWTYLVRFLSLPSRSFFTQPTSSSLSLPPPRQTRSPTLTDKSLSSNPSDLLQHQSRRALFTNFQ